MDALELAGQEEKLVKADEKAVARAKRRGEPSPPTRRPNPVLLNLSPLRYVLRTLQVRMGDIKLDRWFRRDRSVGRFRAR